MKNIKIDKVSVSILCIAYNHEKYIRKCLDGFIMQKTNFNFEVIVHDDASTDKTGEIIREYEKKYPQIVKPIYQNKNQFTIGIPIIEKYMIPKVKGQYIALCEGDDFWIDEYKLQKQLDALESNPNCSMCVCKVRDTNEDGIYMDSTHPSEVFESGVLTTKDFLKLAEKEYVFQTSSFFVRSEEYFRYVCNPPEYKKISPVGDWPQLLYFSLMGDMYYINDEMSCYRRNSIGSFTTVMSVANIEKQKLYNLGLINMMETFDKATSGIYHEYCDKFCNRFKGYYYNCLKVERNFREVLNKENRCFFNKENFKDRLYIRASVFCPFIARLYDKIKKH